MAMGSNSIESTLDHLFRRESGKMVSLLTRIFGPEHLELVEDVVQDTLLKALQQWPYAGIPQNPSAWFFRVAKNRALDMIRHDKFKRRLPEDIEDAADSEWTLAPAIQEIFSEREIPNHQLRMMFACCDPQIPVLSQIALSLKTLCGFSMSEIARAFFTTEETIQKRIYRAKQSFLEGKISLEIPVGKELRERLQAVLHTLYLVFNEGFYSRGGESIIREDMIEEALRLAVLVADHPAVSSPEADALCALMALHAARLPARSDKNRAFILLEDQDRSRWDKALIHFGKTYLDRSARGSELSAYHLEAGIAFQHAIAASFQDTDWKTISEIYHNLVRINPIPMVRLNRAIALLHAVGSSAALPALLDLTEDKTLNQAPFLWAALAEAFLKSNQPAKAKQSLKTALNFAERDEEKSILTEKLNRIDRQA